MAVDVRLDQISKDKLNILLNFVLCEIPGTYIFQKVLLID